MKNKYEHIAIHVDHLLIASEKPQQIIQDLKEKFKLKIIGDGPLEYHLGCDYKPDKDGTLADNPQNMSTRYLNHTRKCFPMRTFSMSNHL